MGIEIAAGAILIGAGISAYSSYQQGKQEDRMAQYNAAVQRNNAKLNEQMAYRQADAQKNIYNQQQQAIAQEQAANFAQAKEAIRRQEMEKESLMAKQRAAYAGAGVVMEGTPLAMLADTESKYAVAEADTLYQTEVKNHSLNFELAGSNYRESLLSLDVAGARGGARIANSYAALTEMQGRAARQAGTLNAVGTLISGVGQAGSSLGSYSKNKTKDTKTSGTQTSTGTQAKSK